MTQGDTAGCNCKITPTLINLAEINFNLFSTSLYVPNLFPVSFYINDINIYFIQFDVSSRIITLTS